MNPAAEQRRGQNVEKHLGIEAALSHQGENLPEHLQSSRRHDIAGKLDQVRAGRIVADIERPLTQQIEDRPDAVDLIGLPAGVYATLPRFGGVRISEYRGGDVVLIAALVLARKTGSGRRAD